MKKPPTIYSIVEDKDTGLPQLVSAEVQHVSPQFYTIFNTSPAFKNQRKIRIGVYSTSVDKAVARYRNYKRFELKRAEEKVRRLQIAVRWAEALQAKLKRG